MSLTSGPAKGDSRRWGTGALVEQSASVPLSRVLRLAFSLLPLSLKRMTGLLVVAMVVNGFVEVSGIAGIMPVVRLASDPQALEQDAWLRWVYDGLGFTSYRSFLIFTGSGFFLAFALVNLVRGFTMWLGIRFSSLVAHRLAHRLLGSYMGRPYAWLLGRNSSDLSKDVLYEVENMVRNIYLPMTEILTNGLASLMIAVTLLAIDPFIAIGTGAGLVGLFAMVYRVNRNQLEKNGQFRDRLNNQRFRAVHEGLYALREARLTARRDHFLKRFEVVSRRYNKTIANGDMIYELPKYLTEILAIGALMAALLYFAGAGPGQAVARMMFYVMATWRMVPSLQNLYRNLARVRFFTPALIRLSEELQATLPVRPGERESRLPVGDGLHFRQVDFSYSGNGDLVLRDVNLTIPTGLRVALVGETGSGKTTVADLAAGLLCPSQGTVLVGDQPLSDDNVDGWQRNVGYVPQEIYLTDDSVSANIALGIPTGQVDLERVREAARLARVDEFIEKELAQGYSTPLGERGSSLSGGQRQRIGIARALYHRPAFLILDEATSALDEGTQRRLVEGLDLASHGLTVLVIAHRLEVVRGCDRIVVMEQGRVKSEGTYAELLETCEVFQGLVQGTQKTPS